MGWERPGLSFLVFELRVASVVITIVVPSQIRQLRGSSKFWGESEHMVEDLRRGRPCCGEASAEACGGQRRKPRPKHERASG